MKVLIIEDETKIANSIKKGLEQESISVDVAYEGESGYDLASSEYYDVIVLDLMLPNIDGMEICRRLREEKISTPILMLTARGSVEDKVSGLNTGADDYLAKPFAFEELVARIKALTRRPKEQIGTILTADTLTLDTITHSVVRNDREIELSKKEYALLEYLLRHKGSVLSKETIAENVWSFDSDVLPNTVEVYVGYLRKKIDKAFPKSQPIIKTIRGFGYKIE